MYIHLVESHLFYTCSHFQITINPKIYLEYVTSSPPPLRKFSLNFLWAKMFTFLAGMFAQ